MMFKTYRCSSCNEMKSKYNTVWVGWYRTKIGPQTLSVAVCRACANKRKPNETGRSLVNRIEGGI